jgi:mannose-6-phosphate isomerase-like protein (cupin superfamily)
MTPARMSSSLLAPGEGQMLPSLWDECLIGAVTPAQTGGAFTLAELIAEPGWRRETYVHHEADECFVVVVGCVTVQLDDSAAPLIAEAGAVLYVPRGVARSLHNTGPGVARILVIQTPGHEAGQDAASGIEQVDC